jgi:hypothetical protein
MPTFRNLTQFVAVGACLAILAVRSVPRPSTAAEAASTIGGCALQSCDSSTQTQCPGGNLACGEFFVCPPSAQGMGICVPNNYCNSFGCTLASGSDCLGGGGNSQAAMRLEAK